MFEFLFQPCFSRVIHFWSSLFAIPDHCRGEALDARRPLLRQELGPRQPRGVRRRSL